MVTEALTNIRKPGANSKVASMPYSKPELLVINGLPIF